MFAGAGAQQAAAAPAVPLGPEGARRQEGAAGRHDHRRLTLHAPALAEGAHAERLLRRGPARRRPKKLLGTVVRYPITAGQPVTRGSLVGPQDRGFLAAALGPGMRAITVPVNVTSRCRRLRLPGRPRRPGADPAGAGRRRRHAAQGLRDDHPQHARARDRPADHRQGRRRQDRRSRPSPTSRWRSRRRLPRRSRSRRASARCRCRCARSPTTTPMLERAIAAGDIKVPAGTSPDQEKQMLLAMANRPIDSNTTFTTGGDVSRFQRRTVPATGRQGRNARQSDEQLRQGLGQAITGQSRRNVGWTGRPCRSRQCRHRCSGGSSLR